MNRKNTNTDHKPHVLYRYVSSREIIVKPFVTLVCRNERKKSNASDLGRHRAHYDVTVMQCQDQGMNKWYNVNVK